MVEIFLLLSELSYFSLWMGLFRVAIGSASCVSPYGLFLLSGDCFFRLLEMAEDGKPQEI